MNNETEQMRARVAIAWGVDSLDIEYIDMREGIGFFAYSKNNLRLNYVPHDERMILEDDKYWLSTSLRFCKVPLNIAKTPHGHRFIRFYYWMGYDIQFLIDAGVNVTAHDRLEWAMQMKERGFDAWQGRNTKRP